MNQHQTQGTSAPANRTVYNRIRGGTINQSTENDTPNDTFSKYYENVTYNVYQPTHPKRADYVVKKLLQANLLRYKNRYNQEKTTCYMDRGDATAEGIKTDLSCFFNTVSCTSNCFDGLCSACCAVYKRYYTFSSDFSVLTNSNVNNIIPLNNIPSVNKSGKKELHTPLAGLFMSTDPFTILDIFQDMVSRLHDTPSTHSRRMMESLKKHIIITCTDGVNNISTDENNEQFQYKQWVVDWLYVCIKFKLGVNPDSLAEQDDTMIFQIILPEEGDRVIERNFLDMDARDLIFAVGGVPSALVTTKSVLVPISITMSSMYIYGCPGTDGDGSNYVFMVAGSDLILSQDDAVTVGHSTNVPPLIMQCQTSQSLYTVIRHSGYGNQMRVTIPITNMGESSGFGGIQWPTD